MMMAGWGEGTQLKLKGSTVFVAGAGGLGSPVCLYLAVAGVGRLRVCDHDAPEMSNLNRQILHDPSRIGMNKAVSAKATLATLNPDVEVTALTDAISGENVDAFVGGADIIVDCMDNFETRYLLNESALRKRIPLVHGAVWGLDGRLAFIRAPQTPCLRCIVPQAPPKEVFPVLGATPGVIGTLQAIETVKYLTGIGQPLSGELLAWEGARMRFLKLKFERDPTCPTCSSLAATSLAR
jgi:adenylyltransferase/sulfurtransferase